MNWSSDEWAVGHLSALPFVRQSNSPLSLVRVFSHSSYSARSSGSTMVAGSVSITFQGRNSSSLKFGLSSSSKSSFTSRFVLLSSRAFSFPAPSVELHVVDYPAKS